MAGWDGSGNFVRLYSWVADRIAGIDIDSTRMDADTNNITVAGFGNCLTRDGQGSATANLPMNGFKLTGLAAGSASGDSARLGQVFAIANNLSEGVAATMRANLGLGSMATQNANNVAITGGSLTGTTVSGVTVTPTGSATLTIGGSAALVVANAKTFLVNNTLTLAGTDGSTLNVGTGGTLGSAAFQNTGTSGANVPLLSGANTWSGAQTFSATQTFSVAPVFGDQAGTRSAMGLGVSTLTGGSAATSQSGSQAHGFGATPTNVYAYLVCGTGELSYTAGEEVAAPSGVHGVTVWKDSTNFGYATDSSTISISAKGGGTVTPITPGNWSVKVVATLNS